MKRSLRFAALAALTVLSACRQDLPETVFRTLETDLAPVRSRLGASDIETKKTGITLAAYGGGTLSVCTHFTASLDAMPLALPPGKAYTVYALVNMGDMTSSFPVKESDLSTITYRIPSYTDGTGSLSARGLPMAGKLDYTGQGTTIPVDRLLAKVTAELSCEWAGAAIRSVKVCNLNRILRPFGESSLQEEWTEQEFQAGTGTASGTFTFYVPENRQEGIDGIRTPEEKSPDRNAEVLARSSSLTYLETVAEGTGLYAGSITYRSYLGPDALTGFDIRRNAHYRWTIRYRADGVQNDDWKHENDLTDTRFLYWKDHPDERELHFTLQKGDYGTRAGNPWRPEDFVAGDATGTGMIQGTRLLSSNLLDYIGYSINTEKFVFYRAFSDAIWFTIGPADLPSGDYETRFFFLDRPDLYIAAWLHVRSESDLNIHDDWDDGGEQELR